MSLNREQIEGISYALNEAGMAGLRISDDQSQVDLLVHVLALPAVGPIDPDARRVVSLLDPSRVEVVLQRGLGEANEPAIPLLDIDAVNAFLSSMTWSHEMYGWPFLDGSAEARSKWPSPISLDMALPGGKDEHSLYWFSECGRRWGDDNYESFFIQGMFTFGEIEIRRASPMRTGTGLLCLLTMSGCPWRLRGSPGMERRGGERLRPDRPGCPRCDEVSHRPGERGHGLPHHADTFILPLCLVERDERYPLV